MRWDLFPSLWELFSLIYYGFPFPNTAYAKLNTGIPQDELIDQGIMYFINSIAVDPLTLTVIGPAVCYSFLSRNARHIAVSIGILLYFVYLLKIGGDFMSGRFVSVPILMGVAVLLRQQFDTYSSTWWTALGLVILLGMMAPYPNLFTDSTFGSGRDDIVDIRGVSDERAFFYPSTGLLTVGRDLRFYHHNLAEQGRQLKHQKKRIVMIEGSMGFLGYYAGPLVHFIDFHGLTDR